MNQQLKCLVDLDGVLVDFTAGICKAHQRADPYIVGDIGSSPANPAFNYKIEQIWGLTKDEFWAPAHAAEFWENLQPMPDGADILRVVEACFPKKNICILTSPSKSATATAGKIRWIQNHLPEYSRQYLVGPRKYFCATPTNVLLDDFDDNIGMFRKYGGAGVLVPRLWNSRWREANQTLDKVEQELQEFCGTGNSV